MKKRYVSKLRGERLQWGLTQEELAPLLCVRHVSQLSRIEHGTRRPSAFALLASSLIFGKDASEIFPGFQAEVEDRIGPRALKLYKSYEGRRSAAARKKRELLESIAQLQGQVCM